MAMRVFIPGSFDPLHLGHVDVIETAARLFGAVVVGVLYNREKTSGLFSPEERVELVRASLREADVHSGSAIAPGSSIEVVSSSALAVDAANAARADFIVKGLRTAADYEIEQQMAHTNFAVSGIRTVFVPCRPSHGFISSRFIREIAAHGGDVNALVSPPVARALSDRFATA